MIARQFDSAGNQMAISPLGITDAQAKAIEATANLGTTVVKAGSDLAYYVSRILGTVPDDVVGLTIGEHLRALRTLAAGWYDIKVQEILNNRRAKIQPVSLSLALPLMHGAYDESREGLRDLWAALIAAAMDPVRASRVRLSFIEALKKFDPLDALVLQERYDEPTADLRPSTVEFFAGRLNVAPEEVRLSADNLIALNCCYKGPQPTAFFITEYGSALVRACRD